MKIIKFFLIFFFSFFPLLFYGIFCYRIHFSISRKDPDPDQAKWYGFTTLDSEYKMHSHIAAWMKKYCALGQWNSWTAITQSGKNLNMDYLQGNYRKGFGWYRISCLCPEGYMDSLYSVTNSWSDIIRTLFENSPVPKYYLKM